MVNFEGLILGAGAFLCIGFFHPLVIKAEYYFGVRFSIFLGIFAFSSFWSIGEVFKQRERVRKGWFPMNPKRKNEY